MIKQRLFHGQRTGKSWDSQVKCSQIDHSFVEKVLLKADALLLVTDNRGLSGSYNEKLVKEWLVHQPPAVIAVRVHDKDTVEKQQLLVKKVSEQLNQVIPSSTIPVVPVRVANDTIVNADVLKSQLETLLDKPFIKEKAQSSWSRKAATEKLQGIAKMELALSGLENELAQLSSQQVIQNILNDFKSKDLSVVDAAMIKLTRALHDHFKQQGLFKSIFKSDYIAQDATFIMQKYSLNLAEYQVIFSDIDGLCRWQIKYWTVFHIPILE